MATFEAYSKKLANTEQQLLSTQQQLEEAKQQLQTTQSAPELKPVLNRLEKLESLLEGVVVNQNKLERMLEGVVVGQNNMLARSRFTHSAVMARIEKLCMHQEEDGEQEGGEQEGGEQEDN